MRWPGCRWAAARRSCSPTQDRTKTPEMLAAFGRAIDRARRPLRHRRGRRHERRRHDRESPSRPRYRRRPAGRRAARSAAIPGRTPRWASSLASRRRSSARSGKDSLDGRAHRAAGRGQRRRRRCAHAAAEGARLIVADVDAARAKKLAAEIGGDGRRSRRRSWRSRPTCSAPARSARSSTKRASPRSTRRSSPAAPTTSSRRREDGERLLERGILYAPDYVINAGGIINVSPEYLGDGEPAVVRSADRAIPGRLEQIWAESAASGRDPAAVADAMAQRLIGRG